TIVEAIDGLRSGIRNAPSDEGTVNSAVMQAETLLAELDTMKALVSEKVMQGLLPVREAADGLLQIAAGDEPNVDKAQSLRVTASSLLRVRNELQNDMLKLSGDAAERFAMLEGDLSNLKLLIEEVETSSALIDSLQLHMERLHAQLTDEAHAAVVADIDALRSSAARVSERGNANMAMASFVDDVAPPLAVVEDSAIAMLSIENEL